jgi:hypothetical protein
VPCGFKLGITGVGISGNSIFSITDSGTENTSIGGATDSFGCIF